MNSGIQLCLRHPAPAYEREATHVVCLVFVWSLIRFWGGVQADPIRHLLLSRSWPSLSARLPYLHSCIPVSARYCLDHSTTRASTDCSRLVCSFRQPLCIEGCEGSRGCSTLGRSFLRCLSSRIITKLSILELSLRAANGTEY